MSDSGRVKDCCGAGVGHGSNCRRPILGLQCGKEPSHGGKCAGVILLVVPDAYAVNNHGKCERCGAVYNIWLEMRKP